MARLPQHPVGPATSSQGLDADQLTPIIASPSPQRLEVGGIQANSGTKRASWRDNASHDYTIDEAPEPTIEVSYIGAISRIALFEGEAGANDVDPRTILASLYGPSLARGLLSFVIPRLRHPDVLRAEKHAVLLERLTRTLEVTPDDETARECLDILQHDLQRFIMLRQNQNNLIKG
ncbi:Putative Type III effector NopAL [Bradyrhizobium sp. ORS 285]|uniref:hypothetical protein n=1 Tax=Bradyrhizobium sp. ORS 285 TaxID=115808 RepID=UPI00024084E6|nr:hypothetical protein [Bradyrhizobium sp. ORS 285]CCD89716.1 conserved hypothetical protein [Bradyrhizobium sp. ORS 285]SMX56348.1 Putative Type III effector NopAL [Bradyrhizobium sp. ORS 285]